MSSTPPTAPADDRPWRIFFRFTAWSVVVVMLMLPLGVMLVLDLPLASLPRTDPLATTLLAAQAALSGWSAWRGMAAWAAQTAPHGRDRWDLPLVGRLRPDASLAAVAAPLAAIAVMCLLGGTDPRLLVVAIATLVAVLAIRLPWVWGLLTSLLLLAIALFSGLSVPHAISTASLLIAIVAAFRSSMWLASVVRELDDARRIQAQLAVAEERLRFARDLHDVTGRDLSAIAVTSELVAQLAERQDPRTAEHAREAAQIARSSLAEIRALVRGYREVDLAAELRGTVSLLRSAGVDVQVQGTADDIPAAHAARAAWVLREGGTNILRHAAPTRVRITLDAGGVRLVNDGAGTAGADGPGRADGAGAGPTPVPDGTGLAGLRERLAPEGSLRAVHDAGTDGTGGGTFTLTARFEDAEPSPAPPVAPFSGPPLGQASSPLTSPPSDPPTSAPSSPPPDHRGGVPR
ncbi:sensor histidine kinase [Brachybacterium sp. DNPG3]